MDVKEAVAGAKKYVGELFAQEGLINIGLEEVEFDEPTKEWHITIGFSRPCNSPSSPWAIATQCGRESAATVDRRHDSS
jgi:hypothetical protein